MPTLVVGMFVATEIPIGGSAFGRLAAGAEHMPTTSVGMALGFGYLPARSRSAPCQEGMPMYQKLEVGYTQP
jgi:hypothetical protein